MARAQDSVLLLASSRPDTMIPCDKLTIVRNRHRARELRRFRELLETYFERAEYVADDPEVGWEGLRAARSEINQMLPRVIQIVHAAGLDAAAVTDPGPTVADVKVLRNIFSARYADGTDQEILDIVDMAIGVHDATLINALARTVNPFHYVMRMLGFVASVPRRALVALGLLPKRGRAPRIRPEDVARLEAVASRLAEADAAMDRRFADLCDRQAQHFAESASLLADLAERLDFLERVLTQQRAIKRLKSSDGSDVLTPA